MIRQQFVTRNQLQSSLIIKSSAHSFPVTSTAIDSRMGAGMSGKQNDWTLRNQRHEQPCTVNLGNFDDIIYLP